MKKIIALAICVCCFLLSNAQPNINKAEYFFNTDPGFGSGLDIPVNAAPVLENVNFNANLTGVPVGLNSMYIRSRDVSGKWSHSNRLLFIKSSNTTGLPNINRVEYFINTDPGFGNGQSISIAAAGDIADAPAAISMSGVPEGLNSLYLRSRDANGRWSTTSRFLFVRAVLPSSNIIATAEYFFDTDPGFGSGVSIPLTPGQDVADVTINANTANLLPGLHSLFIRSKNANNKWSMSNRLLFVKGNNPSSGITYTEYFIDADPGFGKAVPVALNPAANLPDFVINVNITGLTAGDHLMYMRSRDANGNWGITAIYPFKIDVLVAAPLIAINSITKKMLCGNAGLQLAYHSTGIYSTGNIFEVQLSDAAGSFSLPQIIGSLSTLSSGLINCTIPLQIPNGSGYRIRVVSNTPAVTGLVSDTIFTLFTQPRFSDTSAFVVCQNETVNLTTVHNTTGFTTAWNTASPTVAPLGSYQLITSNTPMCRDTAIITVQQDIARWTGATNSDWHNATNWNVAKVPGVKTHVIISDNAIKPCIISFANVVVASMQALPNANLQLANGKTLEVTGNCITLPN